ncbi:uncharacterized protein LOC128962130 [Oppia nitens]|uniref:uncharacterized protein LOC128962130 n=1 Tax=Oppia nitens TaxID=1686743 RepID=UPI0023DA49D9|nr:uncharacterized protein LOC128962130 [Oppia nitens]
MVYKEEVFNWFKEQSGAKRIELMCGLMSMCIPLEIRFFESIIKELAKKDLNALREAEQKANAYQELDIICKCDLLADTHIIVDTNDLKANPVNSDLQTNAMSVKNTISEMATPNGTQNDLISSVPPAAPSPPSSSSNLSQLSSRSRLIVSLCLLSPTNRNCSTIAFKALRTQLTAQQIGSAVSRYLTYRKSIYELEDMFSGILLLLTMALHSPAFSYEQRDLLTKQKEDVVQTIEAFRQSHYRQNTNYTTNQYPNYGAHQAIHPVHSTHLHTHIGGHTTQTHAQSTAGGPPTHSHTHSHTHPNIGHQNTQQFAYMAHPVANLSYTAPPIQNLRISNMTAPSVSTTSPTNSPVSSKSSITSVAAISPLPINAEFVAHTIVPVESLPNQTPYVISTIPHQTISDELCAKAIVSCYNCGEIGHRGDECTPKHLSQTPEETNR